MQSSGMMAAVPGIGFFAALAAFVATLLYGTQAQLRCEGRSPMVDPPESVAIGRTGWACLMLCATGGSGAVAPIFNDP